MPTPSAADLFYASFARSKERALPEYVHRDIAHATRIQIHDPFQAILPQCNGELCGYRQPLSHVLNSIERSARLGIEL